MVFRHPRAAGQHQTHRIRKNAPSGNQTLSCRAIVMVSWQAVVHGYENDELRSKCPPPAERSPQLLI
jgi:hypothetical protein